ncbi:hypothetical protein [Halosimplex halophilum]|uniref:hypothetical protein n=1 Tax=Halosimplex halophilum TaxID=2559572 RepID=UPI00107F32F6|nr:hypothetical protein [Halosimplex halophilum]
MGLVRQVSRIVLTLDVLFVLLLGFSYAFGTFDAETRVVTTLAAIPIVLSFVAAAVVVAVDWDPF